jgi:hypothetical protein
LKLLLFALLLGAPAFAQGTRVIGTFKYPDTSNVNGRLEILLPRSTFGCGSVQVLSNFRKYVTITNGNFPETYLYPSACLNLGGNMTAPSARLQRGAGTGSAFANQPVGNSLEGVVAITTGANTTSGAFLTMDLTNTYPVGPTCNVQVSPALPGLIVSTGARTITFSTSTAPAPLIGYTFVYSCAVYPYVVNVYNKQNQLLYRGAWVVPDTASVDLTALDTKQQVHK